MADVSRQNWIDNTSLENVRIADRVFKLLEQVSEYVYTPGYTRSFIGVRSGDRPCNFFTVTPKKKDSVISIRVTQTEELDTAVKAASNDGTFQYKDGWYGVHLSPNGDYSPLIPVLLQAENEFIKENGTSALASEREEVSIYFQIIEGKEEVVITGVEVKEGTTSVTIPNKLFYEGKDYPVTSIGEKAFYECKSLTEIIIPDSVKSIGDWAFAFCKALKSISIPNGITEIGSSLFSNCHSLNSLIIPNSVTKIGSSAFWNCQSLSAIMIPDSVIEIEQEAFGQCASLTDIVIPKGVKKLCYAMFQECENLTHVTIPDSVIEIENEVFASCSNLTEVIIPNSVTKIGKWCFAGTNITQIILPFGITEICAHTFEECPGLTKITIPDTVTTIGRDAFKNCTNLTNIIIPDSVTELDDTAFDGCNNLLNKSEIEQRIDAIRNLPKVLPISDGQQTIEEDEFSENTKLINVIIPNGIIEIGNYAFKGCYNLTSVIIPDTVKIIGASAFEDCPSLTNITIPNSVTEIGAYAFDGCTGLTKINIPNGVTVIDDEVFEGCSNLNTITLPDSIVEIKDGAFSGCTNLTNITIPNGVTEIAENTFENCTSLVSVIIPAGVSVIGYSTFEGCTSLAKISIPNSVIEIGDDAFKNCTSLTNITLPNSLTKIWRGVFAGCTGLTNVLIPDGVTKIGKWAFKGCTNLTHTTIPNSVTDFGVDIFTDCPNLLNKTEIEKRIYTMRNAPKVLPISDGEQIIEEDAFADDEDLINVIIPDGIIEIEDSAFWGCPNLTSLIIPNTVKKIGATAFENCTSLTHITIPDSLTKIGRNAFKGCTSLSLIPTIKKNQEVFETPKTYNILMNVRMYFGAQLMKLTEAETEQLMGEDLDEVYYDWIGEKNWQFDLESDYLTENVDGFELTITDEEGDTVYETDDFLDLEDRTYPDEDSEEVAIGWEFKGVEPGVYLARIQENKGIYAEWKLELNEPFDETKLYIVQDQQLDDQPQLFYEDNVYPIALYYQRGEGYDLKRDKIHLELIDGPGEEMACKTSLLEWDEDGEIEKLH